MVLERLESVAVIRLHNLQASASARGSVAKCNMARCVTLSQQPCFLSDLTPCIYNTCNNTHFYFNRQSGGRFIRFLLH